jgi:hypothetical protein
MTSAIHMPVIMTSIWVCGTQSAVASRRTNIMFEFEMYNVNTGEIETAYGYSLADARERSPKYENREWVCLMSTYID